MTPEERIKLALEIYEAAAAEGEETFDDEGLGSDLAHLLGSVLGARTEVEPVDSMRYRLVQALDSNFPPGHPVWGFVKVETVGDRDVPRTAEDCVADLVAAHDEGRDEDVLRLTREFFEDFNDPDCEVTLRDGSTRPAWGVIEQYNHEAFANLRRREAAGGL